jgi:tRNA (cmo5U34)-methyltransferase
MIHAMDYVKSHFEAEAPIYADIISRLIPRYHEMITAVVDALPFEETDSFQMIDLGCGIGTVSRAILNRYPKCRITAIDFSEAMIREAEENLNDFSVKFICEDFSTWNWDRSYDAIVSSLALHHLPADDEKKGFYRRCFDHLNHDGVFCNADVVLASRDDLQEKYMDRWIDFMKRSVSEEEIENEWLPKYRQEDVPSKTMDHIRWMSEVGYRECDVIWKYYNFAVFCGYKM